MEGTKTCNPGPLGLAGFGMATLLLNFHNMGLFPMDMAVVAMGIFVGGITQVIVGGWEWKSNNMFGMMAFSGYGFFWLTLAAILVLPANDVFAAPNSISMGIYLSIWALFSLGLWVCTLKMNRWMQTLFASVVLLFVLLALNKFTGIHFIHTLAGIEGVFAGGLALYMAMAQVINDVHGAKTLPV